MRRVAWVTATGAALVALLAPFVTGCPRSDRCAAIDKAPKDAVVARCIPLACPEGAKTDGNGGCVCSGGETPSFGACMGGDALPSYCGVAARPSAGGCAAVPCPAGRVLDRASGVCLPVGSLRAIGKALSIGLYDDETIGCDDGLTLVVRGTTAVCAPPDQVCDLGEVVRKADADAGPPTCVPLPACGAGTLWSAADDRCVRFVSELDGRPLVDVAQWMRAAFGADGGPGTTAVCAAVRDDKRFAASTEDDVVVALELRARGNELSEAELRIDARAHGAPSELARGILERGLRPALAAIRSTGALANAASASTTVHCPIHLGGRPHAVRVDVPGDAGAPDAPSR
jgi:hypothetical protein